MPFTGSHPAAVLPFLRGRLPASALVIGSVAPDLPYYLPLPQPYPTHTWPAVATTDLALGVLAWVLWHGLLAGPAVATAPGGLRARLAGRLAPGLTGRLASGRQVARLLAALVLGAATHLLWDEFTHPRRWGTALVPALAGTWGPLPGYRWLQYASSVAGLLLLLGWAVRWWRRTTPQPAGPTAARWAWPLLLAVGSLCGLLAAWGAGSPDDAVFPAARWAGGSVLLTGALLAACRRPGTSRAPRSTVPE